MFDVFVATLLAAQSITDNRIVERIRTDCKGPLSEVMVEHNGSKVSRARVEYGTSTYFSDLLIVQDLDGYRVSYTERYFDGDVLYLYFFARENSRNLFSNRMIGTSNRVPEDLQHYVYSIILAIRELNDTRRITTEMVKKSFAC